MTTATRFLLEGVPRVHFYDGRELSPEDIPFPNCLAATVRYLGEDYPWILNQQHDRTFRDNYANIYILAHSGMAFGLLWREGWHMDNADHMMVADPAEVIRRAFTAVGVTYEIIHKAETPAGEARYRQVIKESLHAGKPVLGFGVIGPPECCLITGYDENGDVLLGWNFFQGLAPWNAGVEFEPTGEFRKQNWFPDTWSLITIGERTKKPELHTLNQDTLRWALRIARTPKVFDRHSGHAAYTAWANQLSNDQAFLAAGEARLHEMHDAHHNVVGVLAECRWWAAQWLRHIAQDEPAMATHLLAAADSFVNEHDLMWKVWGAVGGNGHPEAWRAFAQPAVRKEIITLIRQAQAENIRAAAEIDLALGQ
jgi:hypothetical protein